MTNESNGAQRPNILYIQSDQHNPNVTGCYGETTVRTPNLDALAARGTVFTNAYCASPLCVPSRTSFLTGQYPHESEVWGNSHILNSGTPTYAHAMGAAGYNPVQVGRMHFVGYDQLHGFAERYVGDHISNYFGGLNPCDHGTLRGGRRAVAHRSAEVRIRTELLSDTGRKRRRRDCGLHQQARHQEAGRTRLRAVLHIRWIHAPAPAIRGAQGGLRPVRREGSDATGP